MKNLYKNIFTLFVFAGSISLSAQTTTFSYTGAVQTYTVGACVTSIVVDITGASGAANGPTSGGLGGRVQATIPVTPGEVLDIYVGQAGINSLNLPAGVYNGGGGVYSYSACGSAGTGGGASDIRRTPYTNSDRLVVAGGGGGAGGYVAGNQTYPGGAGGGLTALDGTPWPSWPNSGGKGGSQASGGAAGIACCSCPTYTTSGAIAQGGNGSGDCAGGGGGGGGYYGGGGSCFAGGGGGSSYTDPSATGVTHTQGYQNGNGQVIITAVNGTPASPVFITGTSTYCQGSTATITIGSVVGASSYTWTVPGGSTINSGQGTTSINVTFGNASGNITVTADNSCGSSAPTTFAITLNPAPTIGFTSSPSSTVCSGSMVTLSGTGGVSYTWSGGITDGVPFSATTTSSYTVTGADAIGCSNTATATITVNPLPTIASTASPSSTVCSGSMVTLNGTGGASYTWSGGITDGVPFSATTTSSYTVTGTDANGCANTATATITVNPLPTIGSTASPSNAVCNGASVTLNGTGGISYTWSGGITDGVAFVPSSTTTYTVTGTDANGCSNTATQTITVNPAPNITGTASPSANVCAGTMVTLNGGGGVSYVWMPGVTDGVPFTPAASLTYTVTGTDANGCTGTATVAIVLSPVPVVDLGPDVTMCGGPVTLDANNPGSTYLWSDGNTTQTDVVSTSGQYYVDVTNGSGCVGSDTINVTINPLPTVTVTASQNIVCLSDAPVALTGGPLGGTFSGPGVTGGAFNPNTAGLGPQVVTYNYTDVNGCTGTAVTTIQVNACTGVAESSLSSGVTIFPNPNSGTFTISVNANVGDLKIEMVDMQGRIVFSSMENNVHAGFTKQVSMENVSNGVYMLRLTTSEEQRIEKVSVQK